ncbi:MAG: class I SAM-dependent methyltransferase [Lachnospiraceae bacterium]|nr:class I SAM-dependent methyltransferase [Lachnospiraceae bacterium]
METYTGFAGVYDQLMDETPYGQWCENITHELEKYGICDGLVLELGCGTGSLTELLAAKGYDMIGLDCSDEMLNIACEKKEQSGCDILYLNQDMRSFELYGTVRAVVSVCDSLNYLLKDDDLDACFRLVNNYLDPGGIFIFDFNTRYKYETVIGDDVIAESREDCSFIWENFFDAESGLNEYDLTVFVRDSDASAAGKELFSRFDEVHIQRGYTLEEMKCLIERSGLNFCRAYDADTLDAVTAQSERIYCVAQEKMKCIEN